MHSEMLWRLARVAGICLLLWGLVLGTCAGAEEPDFTVLQRISLPWACGESHRITWNYESHWNLGNSRGLAFDFSMVEGTSILAPADGIATFKLDEKPFVPNLGNYVDLAIEGGWRVRFAHLRDAQQGERQVRAGEVLGYSGASGASAAHLHLELFKPGSTSWTPADVDKITYLFGLPFGEWYEEASIATHACPANIILAGQVRAVPGRVGLGEPVDLTVPLRNIGAQEAAVRAVQIAMRDEAGSTLLIEAQGMWLIGVQEDQQITVRAWPDMAGAWEVDRVTCIGDDISRSLPAQASWRVEPSPLRLVGMRIPGAYAVGDRIACEVWVENTSANILGFDDIYVEGTRPDHATWVASSGYGQSIPAGGVVRLALQSSTLPQHVGSWQVNRVAFQMGGHRFTFAQAQESFVVLGPQLVVEEIFASPANEVLSIFLLLKNQGTDVASPESVEVWGWQPEEEQAFSVSSDQLTALDPGEAALIRLDVPLRGVAGSWRLAEAGYWNQGTFCRMFLPVRPTILVPPSALDAGEP
jgi:murein DD-endopeptidase MepM/ murein hydrolase activator NlpD